VEFRGDTIVETTDGGEIDVLINGKGISIGQFYL